MPTRRTGARVTYADALRARRGAIAQALLDRRLSRERPIVILSGNSIDHALLALAAMYVGVPYAPIAPAYSLQAQRLRHAAADLRADASPALVFAADGAAFERALRSVLPAGVELVVSTSAPATLPATPFDDARRRRRRPARSTTRATRVDRRHDRQGPVHVGLDRPAEGRHQHAADAVLEPGDDPRRCWRSSPTSRRCSADWLPWNHTAGGNHNFGLVLYNGGTLYIDEGKPTPALFDATLRNLREVPCTAHFTVPRIYEMLLPHLRSDAVLRETFFSELKLLFYAAAGLGQRFWDELRDLADRGVRRRAADHDRLRRHRDRALRAHAPARVGAVRRHDRAARARAWS